MSDPERLRTLAAWYREFAERAANPVIWEMRLATAERLETEAERCGADDRPSGTGARAQTPAPLGSRHR